MFTYDFRFALVIGYSLLCGCGIEQSTGANKQVEAMPQGEKQHYTVKAFMIDVDKRIAHNPLLYQDRVTIEVDAFAQLQHLDTLMRVDISRAVVKDGSFAYLKALPLLDNMAIVDCGIGHDELLVVGSMTQLRKLSLHFSALPRNAEKVISEMKHLVFLDIGGCKFDRAALANIKEKLTETEVWTE